MILAPARQHSVINSAIIIYFSGHQNTAAKQREEGGTEETKQGTSISNDANHHSQTQYAER
jgi:hypothetical protein